MPRALRILLPALVLLAACSVPTSTTATLAPDLGKRVVAEHGVVASAHPRASEAGIEILRQGGNAVDAAVAAAFTVSVGEPQMSGLGGGGAMLIWLQDQHRAEYVDFYSAQRPQTWRGLVKGGPGRTDLRRVAIPGEVAGLLDAQARFGKLSRAAVMAPAIRLAEEGYPVNQILAQMIAHDSAKLFQYPRSRAAFWPNGKRLQPGDTLHQTELALTLRRIAELGRAGFDEGPVAESLIRQLNEGGHPATLADLAAFTPQWKRPLCGDYRGMVVLSAAPPQTGHQIIHTLELLEPYNLRDLGLPTRSARGFDVVTSAMRVGMTAARYGQDPNWSPAPVTGVISPAYAASRAGLVGTGRVSDIEAADPTPFTSTAPPAACAPLDPYRGTEENAGSGEQFQGVNLSSDEGQGETTHLSVVDANGNAVALTQTNSSTFGVGARAAGGFMLNDSGVDYSQDPNAKSDSASTATVAGRNSFRIRRSTIAPTIVLEDGRVQMVVGAPGGGRIPTEILQNMIYVLDYGLDPLEALRMPRIYPSATSPVVQLENGFSAALLGQLRAMGYEPTAEASGYARLYMIVRSGNGWIGAADPRHNGEARGY